LSAGKRKIKINLMHKMPASPALFALWLTLVAVTPLWIIDPSSYAIYSDLNRQFQTAVALYQTQQYDQARQVLERLLRQAPDSFEMNELMGLICTGQHKASQANFYFTKAVHLQPQSGQAHTYLAANLVDLGQNERAEIEFKRAVRLEPASYEANHNLGEFYIRIRKLAAAITYLKKAQQIQPSAYNNGYDLALAEIKTRQYADAKTEIRNLQTYHDSAELYSLLATIYEKTGQYIQAAKEYELAAHMDPSEQNIFDWGSELLLHHTLEPATQVFAKGVQLYPRSVRLQIGLGIALYSRTHYQEAIDAFCHAIDLNPEDPRPYVFLGRIYDVSPLQAEAVTRRFARFAQLQPRNPQALYYYALSLWKGARTQTRPVDLQQVEKLLERAVLIDPAFADAHFQLGTFYAQERRYPAAIEQYQRAIQLQPTLADAHYRLGEALARTGKKDQAQQQFRIFSQLHAQQVKDREKQRSEIMQFVYTMKPTGKNP
jgi:tetratricopeptide (TPR) repeat protein